ncbi:hypothetical protein CFOL_v3_14081 [Cephalotus follicularis]|uniref:Uncharacterized protein n=1 Tax=Cephalotus follicularis TaxID=3775 RepID=A0A1Q3BS50_CEPFO|nr:hypothetical protein CFOL_v3_14081 [Cephalotus follicularis]
MDAQDNKKRAREGEETKDSSEKIAKKIKMDLNHHSNYINLEDNNNVDEHDHDNDSCDTRDNYTALGVFDFPWLHEGTMISNYKSEEWNFEDTFSTTLKDSCITAGLEFPGECLCDETVTGSIEFPAGDDKFEENVLWPMEGDGLDWICSSLQLNQPPHQLQGVSISND